MTQGIGGILHECLLPWIPDIISYFHEALLNGLHISLQVNMSLQVLI